MANENRKLTNFLLALGILFFLGGISLVFLPPFEQIEEYHFLLNIFLVLLTALMVYLSLLSKKPLAFYVSINLCLLSLVLFLLNANSVRLKFDQFWPVIIIFCGITLLPVGRIHYRKFRTVYVIPSAALTVLGVFFFLFTFNIIKVPLRVFFRCFMPFFFIFCGIFLFVIYYVRQKNKDVFPVIQDDEYDDEDEDDDEDFD